MISLLSSLNNITSADPKRSGVKSAGSEGSAPANNSVIPVDYKSFKTTWTEVVHINRERWRAKVPKGNVLLHYHSQDSNHSRPGHDHPASDFVGVVNEV